MGVKCYANRKLIHTSNNMRARNGGCVERFILAILALLSEFSELSSLLVKLITSTEIWWRIL